MVTVEVKIGRVVGKCPACGTTRFLAARKRRALKATDTLECTGCSSKIAYGALVQQVTLKAIGDIDRVLEASKQRTRRDG
jgi:hypothetical protein